MKLDYGLSSCTEVNSKWIKDLNVRSETITYVEENRYDLMDLGYREHFLALNPKTRKVKAKINA